MSEHRYPARAGPRIFVSVLVLLVVIAGVVDAGSRSQPNAASVDMWGSDWVQHDWWELDALEPLQQKRMARHQHYMDYGVPKPYRGERNPYPVSPEVVQDGRMLYAANCRDCHGPVGMGDGHMALAVNPSPALLAFMIQTPLDVDEYLMWSISEGGALFGSDMPAFKDRLSIAEIWKIIAYMRAGFPRAE